MTTTQLFIARHGETQWNLVKKLQGHLDSPLTKVGNSQALTLANAALKLDINGIFSSPLNRALSTAQTCVKAINKPLNIEPLLIERNFGDWQSCYFNELSDKSYFNEIFKQVTSHAPPNGESGIDCGNRISSTLKHIAQTHKGKNILVITHGDAIRCLFGTLKQLANCDAYSQYGNGKLFNLIYCHNSESFLVD